VARLVARHRERSLPMDPGRDRRFGYHRYTPTDVLACDHGDGRSPGSRVTTLRRLPGTRESQWHNDGGFAAYSCGGSRSIRQSLARTAFPFDPDWEPSPYRYCEPRKNQGVFLTPRLMSSRCVETATKARVRSACGIAVTGLALIRVTRRIVS
jgi:hypothetical protein